MEFGVRKHFWNISFRSLSKNDAILDHIDVRCYWSPIPVAFDNFVILLFRLAAFLFTSFNLRWGFRYATNKFYWHGVYKMQTNDMRLVRWEFHFIVQFTCTLHNITIMSDLLYLFQFKLTVRCYFQESSIAFPLQCECVALLCEFQPY